MPGISDIAQAVPVVPGIFDIALAYMYGNIKNILLYCQHVTGHGRLMDPVSRSSMWRKGLNGNFEPKS